jgi:hypothetical protein
MLSSYSSFCGHFTSHYQHLRACVWSRVSLLHCLHYFAACGGDCAGVGGCANLFYSLFTLEILDEFINVHAENERRERRNQHFDAASFPITWCCGVSPEMEIVQIELVFLDGSLGECAGNDDGVKDYATVSKSR